MLVRRRAAVGIERKVRGERNKNKKKIIKKIIKE